MHHFRERWLAVFGGILLVTLSVSSVFGARPENADGNRGQSVSAFAHSLVLDEPSETDEAGDADQVEEEDDAQVDETEDGADAEDAEETEAADGADADSETDAVTASIHGACVSEVARDKEAIGGVNMNHGGAVSEAARVTCKEDQSEEDAPVTDEAAADESQAETDTDASATATADTKDKATKPSHAKSEKAKSGSHGKGHEQRS